MRTGALRVVIGVVGLWGCGGSVPKPTSPPNPFVGTLTVEGALPSGTTACLHSHTITFTGAGASTQLLSVPGGDCIAFLNGDLVDHQPAQIGTNCPELNAPGALAPGATYATPALDGPRTCQWQDLLSPPGSGY